MTSHHPLCSQSPFLPAFLIIEHLLHNIPKNSIAGPDSPSHTYLTKNKNKLCAILTTATTNTPIVVWSRKSIERKTKERKRRWLVCVPNASTKGVENTQKTKHYCNEKKKAITKNTIYSEIPHIKHIAQNDLDCRRSWFL